MISFDINKLVPFKPLNPSLVKKVLAAARRVLPQSFSTTSMQLSIAIIPNARMRQLNSKYRGVNATTDVLSFTYDNANAEIILSAPVIRRQAAQRRHSLSVETATLIAHGLLHILGFDHERSYHEARIIRAHEQKILSLCGFP